MSSTMPLVRKTVFGLVLPVLLILPFSASAVFIDFESFSDRENIAGVDLGGVTLTSPDNGNVIEIYDDRFGVSSHSGSKAIGNFNSGSPDNVPLMGTFDEAVSFVSLWAGDTGFDSDSWTLNLYDAAIGGSLITSLNSPITDGSPYTELSFAGDNIWRFEAIWTGPDCCGIGFDDLMFTVATNSVPAPSALLLLGIGLIGLGLGRSRRNAHVAT